LLRVSIYTLGNYTDQGSCCSRNC